MICEFEQMPVVVSHESVVHASRSLQSALLRQQPGIGFSTHV
jgi:hypothetical protein